MKVRKFIPVLTVAIAILSLLSVVPTPVNSSSSSSVSFLVEVDPELGYIPQKSVGDKFKVNIRVNASELTYNGPDGMVRWAAYVYTDATILKPLKVWVTASGYFLYDFAEQNWYDSPLSVYAIKEEDGYYYVDVAEGFTLESIEKMEGGAATDTKLPTPYLLFTIGYEVVGEGSTLIDIRDAVYTNYTHPSKEYYIPVEDIDGWYGEPIPEFPLGPELLMFVALAVPVVYLWKTRRWVRRK
jgi:hypothetical protein